MEKHFVVSAFIFYENKKKYNMLLLNHKKLKKWIIPGGHIEQNENPIEAIVREIWEETGLEDFDLITFNNDTFSYLSDSKEMLIPEFMTEELIPQTNSESQHIHIDLFYVAITKEKNIVLNGKEANDIKWVDFEDIYKFETFDSTKSFSIKLLKLLASSKMNTVYRIKNKMILKG